VSLPDLHAASPRTSVSVTEAMPFSCRRTLLRGGRPEAYILAEEVPAMIQEDPRLGEEVEDLPAILAAEVVAVEMPS